MNQSLVRFFADMALDHSLLASFYGDPEGTMRAAGLSDEDRAAVVSGQQDAVHGRLLTDVADVASANNPSCCPLLLSSPLARAIDAGPMSVRPPMSSRASDPGPLSVRAPLSSRASDPGPLSVRPPMSTRGPLSTRSPESVRGPLTSRSPDAVRSPLSTRTPDNGPASVRAPISVRSPDSRQFS